MKTIKKLIRGKRLAVAALVLILTLTFGAGPAKADDVDIQCLAGLGGGATEVQNDVGAPLPQGNMIQVFIANGGIDAIDRNNPGDHYSASGGNDTWVGDYVVGQGGTATDGTFYIGGATIMGQAYIRAWNHASPPSATYYGVSQLSASYSNPIGTDTWDVPTFATNQLTVQPGTLQFSSATYSVSEAGPTVTITVTRVGGSSGAASVNYATSNGTATAGQDYTATSGTLNWSNSDSASKTFNISITDDSVYEGNETVNLTLTNAVGASMGSPSTSILTITENDPVPATGAVQFSSGTYSVSEAGPTVTITVTRVGGSSGAASVNYATSNGTATAGQDYTATSGTLNWSNSDSASKTFNISITDDSVYEGNETVNLTLSTAVGASMGSPSSAILTITENDPVPATGAVQFDSATYGVDENVASIVITVTRTGGSDGAASVDYATSDGTATAGVDYTAASGTLNWTDSDSASKTFNVPIIDDGDVEGNETVNLTLSNVSGSVLGSPNTAILTITDDDGGGAVITGVSPDSTYVGQTIVITGSGLGTSGTITIGGVPATPTAWGETSITVAVPDGVAPGSVDVVVNGSTGFPITISDTGVVIDDFEGGCVGDWQAPADASGYYAYGSGVTPATADITNDGPQAEALSHGTLGMKVKYSYDGVETYGGWGATRVGAIDISSYSSVSFYINWDGSINDIKLGFEDSAGHVYFAPVSHTTLALLNGYGQVTVNMTSFTEDVDNDSRTPGAIDWSDVLKYSFTYINEGITSNYQYIDSISAGTVDWGDGPVVPGDVVITLVDPAAGPAGTKFTVTGYGFGAEQGQSVLVFANMDSKVSYPINIISWSETSIEAIVPTLAPVGDYTLKVVKIAISQGTVSASESGPKSFLVTGAMSSSGIATVFPNPFNPLATQLAASGFKANEATIAYQTGGATNIGIYIYDSTARLVYHSITTDSQITWDGTDTGGNHVADGIYLLRVVNEESKSLIAKAKILVIKQ